MDEEILRYFELLKAAKLEKDPLALRMLLSVGLEGSSELLKKHFEDVLIQKAIKESLFGVPFENPEVDCVNGISLGVVIDSGIPYILDRNIPKVCFSVYSENISRQRNKRPFR